MLKPPESMSIEEVDEWIDSHVVFTSNGKAYPRQPNTSTAARRDMVQVLDDLNHFKRYREDSEGYVDTSGTHIRDQMVVRFKDDNGDLSQDSDAV